MTSLDDALRAATEAAAHAAQEILDAHHVKLAGVLVVAELTSPDPTDTVNTGSWLFVSEKSSLPVVADTLRSVVTRLAQQAPALPKTERDVN